MAARPAPDRTTAVHRLPTSPADRDRGVPGRGRSIVAHFLGRSFLGVVPGGADPGCGPVGLARCGTRAPTALRQGRRWASLLPENLHVKTYQVRILTVCPSKRFAVHFGTLSRTLG